MFDMINNVKYNHWNSIGKGLNLYVETIIDTGSKDKDKNRRDAAFYKTFDSRKYENREQLDSLTINPIPYLSFRATGYNEQNEWTNFEIWLGEAQIETVTNLFNEVVEELVANMDKIYKKDKISKEWEEKIYETDSLGSLQNKIAVYPDIIYTSENKPLNGVVIVLRDADENDYYTETGINNFINLVNKLNRYNIDLYSMLLTNIALSYQLMLGNTNNYGNDEEENNGRKTNSSRRFASNKMAGRNKRSPLERRKRVSSVTTTEVNDEDDEDDSIDSYQTIIDETDNEELEKKNTSKKNNKKNNLKKSTKTVNADNLSLQDMLDAAGDVDLGELDDEEVF